MNKHRRTSRSRRGRKSSSASATRSEVDRSRPSSLIVSNLDTKAFSNNTRGVALVKVGTITSTGNPPFRPDLVAVAATVFHRYLSQIGLSAREFCEQFNLPQRTFDAWMANRTGSRAAGHTKRGPIRLLQTILDTVTLPEHVAEALRDVTEYGERFLRRREPPQIAPKPPQI
ncbi:MAG: hypothetical protein H6883_02590 [Rhodobiaceae bacterium]|nr:hypothetical protein [Rhodobiaceae bacterium]MCC0055006.1 hypothetical protein [Rhodobiaceae bacterium]